MQCRTSLSLLTCHARRPYTAAVALARTFCLRNEFYTSTAARSDGVNTLGTTTNLIGKKRERISRLLTPSVKDDNQELLALFGPELASQILDFNHANSSSGQWRTRMRLIAEIGRTSKTLSRHGEKLQDALVTKPVQDIVEYKPEVFHLLPEMNRSRNSPMPWRVNRIGTMSAMQVLGDEILRFSHFMQPSHEEKAARNGVFEYMKSILKDFTRARYRAKAGNITLEPHGSVLSGLALTASDIDFRIFSSRSDNNIKVFRTLTEDLHRSVYMPNITHDKELLAARHRRSRYPIISCQHRLSGLDIQMVATIPSTKQQAATAQYLSDFPLLAPLYAVLRQTLNHRGLLDVFYGGLGSYPLLMMIVAVLHREPDGRQEVTPEAVANHLLHFLHFYSSLDTRTTGLTVDPPLDFPKQPALPQTNPPSDRHPDPALTARQKMTRSSASIPYLLTLQDPADSKNDLGCRTYAIKHILTTFQHLYQTLLADIRQLDERIGVGQSEGHESLLLPLVGDCYEAYAQRRSKAEEFGRYVLAKHAAGERIRSNGPRGQSVEVERAEGTGEGRIPSPFS